MKINKKEIQRLSKMLTDEIFTPRGCNYRADHIQLHKNGEYICGWAYRPAMNAVEFKIKEFLQAEKDSKKGSKYEYHD